MTDIRVVRYDDVDSFLEAIRRFDDSLVNFCLGALYDLKGQPQKVPPTTHFLAVYRGDELL